MSNSKDAVRKILDAVKADKRTSLTAPEGKLVCDAYGIPVPKEGVATIRRRSGEARRRHGLSGGDEDRLAGHPAQDRSRRRDGGRQERGRRRRRITRPSWPTPRSTRPDAQISGVQVQQMLMGGQEVIIGAVTDGSFGKLVAFGLGGVLVEVLKDITFRLAPGDQGRRALDARRHPGRRNAEGRARQRSGQPRRAGRDHRRRLASWSATSRKSPRWT